MGNSKGFPFQSGTADNKASDRTASRVREASVEEAPLDQLMLQLRKIVAGPTERVFEARMEEMLDILDEQIETVDFRMDKITGRVEDVANVTEGFAKGMRLFDGRLAAMSEEMSQGSRKLEEAFSLQLAKSHDDLEDKIVSMGDMLRSAMHDLETKVRANLDEMSHTLSDHIVSDETRIERDRENVLSSVEQRIAQWRAEIEDMRSTDREEVASSIMDIGQRLLALRKL
jgi:F0F1-type ATP synthase membrane subunit b/b'